MTAYRDLSRELIDGIRDARLDLNILAALIPNGEPLSTEGALWDYKRDSPNLPESPTDGERNRHKAEMAEVIKDAVSFYNMYGGYVAFGVDDKAQGSTRVLGSSSNFDVGEFNKRIEGAVGRSVECRYSALIEPLSGHRIGLLLVPRRPDHVDPVAFRKAAPSFEGKRAFGAHEVYGRFRDECRPATASSADWRLLHGPRISAEESPGAPSAASKPRVVSSLPPRDPELVEFVGREPYLARLREWLSDPRSATRLLTGIGGLGKTTIAYRFCEEVVDLGSNDIERLIWFTAKQKSYSAIRGQLVETSRVDFDSPESLYRAVLARVGYAPAWDDEEPSTEDYGEAIVEALSLYSSLIVVDDIDSLPPEAQKEVVFTLSTCAARTIDGQQPPSRFLFTSRIDQGFPPGQVIKVEGFDVREFGLYVAEVTATLGINMGQDVSLREFWLATSGSPLFAASILRLIKLGTPMSEALASWQGHDGVEVRRFAFRRELERLEIAPARLLYAVCLLGATSPIELSHVLEITQVAVGDNIARLQAFHLISAGNPSGSGRTVLAPDDVILTRDVLRDHLGAAAESVERACGRARANAEREGADIASSIGRVVSLWRENLLPEALSEANRLEKRHSENADVQCLYGVALIRSKTNRWSDADKAFTKAKRLGCTRPELLDNWLLAKRHMEDWRGIIDITRGQVPARGGIGKALRANVQARFELIKAASIRGDPARMTELARDGVLDLSKRISGGRNSQAEETELEEVRLSFAKSVMDGTIRVNRRPGDSVRIFDAAVLLFDLDVRDENILAQGVDGLLRWWSEVERRPYVDEPARDILKNRLSRIERLERAMAPDQSRLSGKLRDTRLDLAYRGSKLSE